MVLLKTEMCWWQNLDLWPISGDRSGTLGPSPIHGNHQIIQIISHTQRFWVMNESIWEYGAPMHQSMAITNPVAKGILGMHQFKLAPCNTMHGTEHGTRNNANETTNGQPN